MPGAWAWRSMELCDLGRVVRLADALFPDHPEDAPRFAERQARGGDLCLVLASEADALGGYAVAYPWPLDLVPPLNQPVAVLPDPGTAIYLHDLGVRPDLSGAGHARAGLALLVERARAAGHTAIALVAVNGSAAFWRARGFAVRPTSEAAAAKVASYGPDARYMVLPL
jgi:ribosomal protein S18 acetylase RimI-like enzyme